MSRILPALVLTAVLAGLTSCGSSTPTSTASSSSAQTAGAEQTTTPEQTTSAGESSAPQSSDGQVITLTVTGGKVSGDTGRVSVPLGSTVQLQVTADVADEVHVHGYDLMTDTVPGQPVTIELTADIPGVFEVELEQAKLPLTRLQVQ